MIQQSHLCIYIQKIGNRCLKEISAFPCLLQHYSHSQGVNTTCVRGQMKKVIDRNKGRDIHISRYIIQPLKKENPAIRNNGDEPGS